MLLSYYQTGTKTIGRAFAFGGTEGFIFRNVLFKADHGSYYSWEAICMW